LAVREVQKEEVANQYSTQKVYYHLDVTYSFKFTGIKKEEVKKKDHKNTIFSYIFNESIIRIPIIYELCT